MLHRLKLFFQHNKNAHPALFIARNILISIKKCNPNHDTSSLERQIDAIVYKIYGLTDAEIKIIEQSI